MYASTFPHPLTEEEEAMYIRQLKDGDDIAIKTLVERNLRLVAYIARKFESTGIETDDLISIGTIGLIKGVRSYKPEKGTKLSSYSSRCIENEILMFLRKEKKRPSQLSLEEPIVSKRFEDLMTTLSEVLCDEKPTPEEHVVKKLDIIDLNKLLQMRLSEREQFVIRMKFGQEKTYKEIGMMLGISRSAVSRIGSKSIKKLCKELQKF